MPAPEHSAEIEQIRKGLIERIDAELEKRQPLYLSNLGADMGEKLKRLKLLTGQSLASVIEQDYQDRYQIVRLGARKNVIALLKPGETLKSVVGKDLPGSQVRYTRDLWLAFSVPASAPHRYIHLTSLKFIDSCDTAPPEGFLEIEQEFLRSLEEAHDPDTIVQNIGRWFAKYKIDPSPYLQKQTATIPSTRQTGSVLELVLSLLDRRQLQSISLPLDVVETLLRNRP